MHAEKSDFLKLDRLKRRSEFLRLTKIAQSADTGKWVTPTMVVQIAPIHPEDGKTASRIRYGLTVSKKVSKAATDRNRIKRRLRSAAREVLPQYAPPGHDIVLIGRAGTLTASYTAILKDLRWALKRLGKKADE